VRELPDRQQGISLLEMLLVFALASSIILFALQRFNQYTFERNVQTVQAHVKELFQALGYYYQINCSQVIIPNPAGGSDTIRPGTLDPMNTPIDPFPLTNINTIFTAVGLGSVWPFLKNPIVDVAGLNNNEGYVVQFNRSTSTRDVQLDSGSKSVGNIIIWRAQVSVLLRSNLDAAFYQKVLGADCLSSASADNHTVQPCSAQNPGNYAVWEKLPSYTSPDSNTDLWPSLPVLKQFNQMYSTYPITVLTSDTAPNQQNYLCGG
jgi:type II secretory pathway pseudopilin PulG